MSLLEVLSDSYVVCRNHLFSFLDVNDLLRLRRVSRQLKHVAEDFIGSKKVKTGQQLDIHFGMKRPFEKHFKFRDTSSVLPQRTSLVFNKFNNREKSFSMSGLLQYFLDTFDTTNITKLTIQGLAITGNCKRMLRLFDSFPHVTQLDLPGLLAFDGDELEQDVFASLPLSTPIEITFPTSFKKLQHLEISLDILNLISANLVSKRNLFAFCVRLVETCISNLEFLFVPFDTIVNYLGVGREEVMRFICMCLSSDHKVKLVEFNASFIEELLETDGRTLEMGTIEAMASRINAKVESVHCPETMTFLLELPNLEKVSFEIVSRCKMPNPGFLRHNWTKLAGIGVEFKSVVDSEDDSDGRWTPSLNQLWDFLFVGIIRQNLVVLQLGFDGFEEPNASFSRTADIMASCPNVKVLHLETQIKELISLPELWKGLPQLEKLFFYKCGGVSDADFVGEDELSPVFWNLKCLKALKFRDIDKMQVTNDLFSKVLCHMPLKKLCVHSTTMVDSISLSGIECLLDGKFATTIERLCLNLAGVSSKEQKRVKKLFRSWQMV